MLKTSAAIALSICGLSLAGTATRLDRVPLYFETNRGQASRDVEFIGRAGAGTFLLRRDGGIVTPQGVTVRLRGAGKSAAWSGVSRLRGVSNYFIGSDAKKWVRDVPQFSRVERKSIYPGIDIVYYGGTKRNQLEYDFVIAPGADPSRIAIAFEGPGKIERNADGEILAGRVIQRVPRVYQDLGGKRVVIEAK
jgi:hypothetical protein